MPDPLDPRWRGTVRFPGGSVGGSARGPGLNPEADVSGYVNLLRALGLDAKTGVRRAGSGASFPTRVGLLSPIAKVAVSGSPELSAGFTPEGEPTGPHMNLPLGSVDLDLDTPLGSISAQRLLRSGRRGVEEILEALLGKSTPLDVARGLGRK